MGCAGAIDGLAGMFPRVMVALYEGYVHDSMSKEDLRRLQYDVARGEELITEWGTIGVKEGVSRVLGFGDRDGTRAPLKGGLPEGEWAKWEDCFRDLAVIEKELERKALERQSARR